MYKIRKSGKCNPSLIMHDLPYIKSVGLVLKCIFHLNAIQVIKYVRKYSTSSQYVSYKIPINNNKHKWKVNSPSLYDHLSNLPSSLNLNIYQGLNSWAHTKALFWTLWDPRLRFSGLRYEDRSLAVQSNSVFS